MRRFLKRPPVGWGLRILLVGLLFSTIPIVQTWDLKGLDVAFRLHRRLGARPEGLPQVVIVGIDEASIRAIPEPLALYHRPLGRFLEAMATAEPAAVGLDVILPERSWESVLPGSDAALVRGILRLNRRTPLVLGRTEFQGVPRPIHAPFETAAGPDRIGFVQCFWDPDQVLRRFETSLAEDGTAVPTFAGRLAQILGHEARPGIVDFTRGRAFAYTPLEQVLAWQEAGDVSALRTAFSGRIVLLGSVLPYEDRTLLPVRLAGWEQESVQDSPGVLMQGQILRTLLARGSIVPIPGAGRALLILLAAAAGMGLAFASRRGFAALLLANLALPGAAYLLLEGGIFLPVAGIAGALVTGYAWGARRKARRRFLEGLLERRVLERALLDTAERERRSLGHLLHDGPCQQMTAALMRCRLAERSLAGREAPEADTLKVMAGLLDASLGEVHDLARGLSPGDLEEGRLEEALGDLSRRIASTHGIACACEGDGSGGRVGAIAGTQLYRIAQEAVNNALKHGEPRSIWIRLGEEGGRLHLTVENDGRALGDPSPAREAGGPGGMGQRIMRYRAELIQGALALEDRPGGGVRLTCILPMPPSRPAEGARSGGRPA